MEIGSFPFKYVGVMISLKRLLVNQCNYLIERVSNCIKSWNHSQMSIGGRVVLVNSSLVSIPFYLLSCYHIPDTTLESITKLARHFIWGKGSNNSDISYLSWSITSLHKSEDGLSIKNLNTLGLLLCLKIFRLFLMLKISIGLTLFGWNMGIFGYGLVLPN